MIVACQPRLAWSSSTTLLGCQHAAQDGSGQYPSSYRRLSRLSSRNVAPSRACHLRSSFLAGLAKINTTAMPFCNALPAILCTQTSLPARSSLATSRTYFRPLSHSSSCSSQTNFLFFGELSLDFCFHLFFFARYSKMLESGAFAGRQADFVWMLTICCASLLVSRSISTSA